MGFMNSWSCVPKKTKEVLALNLDTAEISVYQKALDKAVKQTWVPCSKKVSAEGAEQPVAPLVVAPEAVALAPVAPVALAVHEVVREGSPPAVASYSLCSPSLYSCYVCYGLPWLSRSETMPSVGTDVKAQPADTPSSSSRCHLRRQRSPQPASPPSQNETKLALRSPLGDQSSTAPGEVPSQENPKAVSHEASP